jgi:hypothetical protein
MKDSEWNVNADGEECVHVTISDSIDIEGMELVILSDTRTPIIKMKLNSRDIHICTHTDRPMFAQIGHSVKYVAGSGAEYYQNEN